MHDSQSRVLMTLQHKTLNQNKLFNTKNFLLYEMNVFKNYHLKHFFPRTQRTFISNNYYDDDRKNKNKTIASVFPLLQKSFSLVHLFAMQLSCWLPPEGSKAYPLQFTHEEEAAVGVWGGGRIGTRWRANRERKTVKKEKKKSSLIKVTSCHASSVWRKGRARVALLQLVLHHNAAALRSGTNNSDSNFIGAAGFLNGFIRACNRSGRALFPLDLQDSGVGGEAFCEEHLM